MSSHHFQTSGKITGIVTLPDIYDYEGFVFEFHRRYGPQKLRKSDWEPAERQGRKFYAMLDRWLALTDEQKEDTRLFG